MNNSIMYLIKNFSHVFSANFISLLISTLSIVIIPKLIGVEEYGYWQLYLFYLSYVGFFHFGLVDGVYLKYGGFKYEQLDKKLFASQFWFLLLFEVLLGCCIFLWGYYYSSNFSKIFIIEMICINLLIILPKTFLLFTLQATNRMREYASVLALEKIIYGVTTIVVVFSGVRDYRVLIYVDIIAKCIAFALSIYYCKDIVISNCKDLITGFKEAIDNVQIGIKLMFANIASLLIMGIVRFGIERNWDIKTFGKISLTLSISNMLMIFVNAIGTVLYPMLRNTPTDRLPIIYIKMRNLLMILLIGLMIGFYPAKWIFSFWLNQYSESLRYMALLFPICIYESKMSMLISTYFKTLRKEKLMMNLNWITVGVSLISTYICVLVLDNLTLTVLSITIILAFRCIISELILALKMNIGVWKDIILELCITTIFIATAWFMGNIYGMLVFAFTYAIYLFLIRKDLKEAKDVLTKFIRPKFNAFNK